MATFHFTSVCTRPATSIGVILSAHHSMRQITYFISMRFLNVLRLALRCVLYERDPLSQPFWTEKLLKQFDVYNYICCKLPENTTFNIQNVHNRVQLPFHTFCNTDHNAFKVTWIQSSWLRALNDGSRASIRWE